MRARELLHCNNTWVMFMKSHKTSAQSSWNIHTILKHDAIFCNRKLSDTFENRLRAGSKTFGKSSRMKCFNINTRHHKQSDDASSSYGKIQRT